MILAAAFQPELEDSLMQKYTFLMQNISTEDKFKLLFSKNKENLRPLEFSMYSTTPGMFQGKPSRIWFNLIQPVII